MCIFLRRCITYQNLKGIFDSHTHTKQTKPKKTNKQKIHWLPLPPWTNGKENHAEVTNGWKSNNLGTEQGLESSSPHSHAHVSPPTPHSLEWEKRIVFTVATITVNATRVCTFAFKDENKFTQLPYICTDTMPRHPQLITQVGLTFYKIPKPMPYLWIIFLLKIPSLVNYRTPFYILWSIWWP